MKKFFTLLSLLVVMGMSANVMAQGSQQTVTVNSTRNYWVNSTNGTTQNTDHEGNGYAWTVYTWDVSDDYSASGWTATAATSGTDYTFEGTSSGTDVFATQIKWLATGNYVVEVVETNAGDGCTTVRRFGVTIIDLDLLVVTKDHNDVILTAAGEFCNTNAGSIFGDEDADDLNSATGVTPAMGTMIMTYEITLHTEKGGDAPIGNSLPDAGWKFSVQDDSTIPTGLGNVTWTVTDGTGTYTTGDLNEIIVAAGTSTVTITAEIKNIADAATEVYELGFSIDPATVLVENGGTAGDYAEGEEPAGYDGTDGSHINSAYTITVNPIPNTSKIKFN